MKEAIKNEQEKNVKKLRTYFGNNLTVIKDNGLFKVLFKLTSLQMKEYNKAVKHNLPTVNITFQYSLNEFRLDLQMGKATILKKFDILTKTGLLSTEKCKDEKNSYCKNTYQLNINKLDSIIDTLNGMRRKERIEYINNIFNTKTSSAYNAIKEDKIEEDVEPLNDNEGMLDTDNNDMKEMVKVMLSAQAAPIVPSIIESPSIETLIENSGNDEIDLSFLDEASEPTPTIETEVSLPEISKQVEKTYIEYNKNIVLGTEEEIEDKIEELKETSSNYDYSSINEFSSEIYKLIQVKPTAAEIIINQIKKQLYPNREAVLKDIETNINLYTKVIEKEK